MFLQVEDRLFYKQQRERLRVGQSRIVQTSHLFLTIPRGFGSMGTCTSSNGCNRL